MGKEMEENYSQVREEGKKNLSKDDRFRNITLGGFIWMILHIWRMLSQALDSISLII
jgi:hypothetical protein